MTDISQTYPLLNDNQQKAVLNDDKPMIIFAGAGSGKTRVIAYRMKHFIESGVEPWSILAITFTNKAAKEMRSRVSNFVQHGSPVVGTFHSLCARILREHADVIGYSNHFVIFDSGDQKVMVKRIIKEMDLSTSMYTPSKLISAFSKYTREMIKIDDLDQFTLHQRNIIKVFKKYKALKKQSDGMDFDDLISNVVVLFMNNPDILKLYQERYRHLFVDEFQDTNAIQYKLLSLLSKKYRSICVVGDDDQSIYRFRGADIRNIDQFMADFSDVKVFKLEQNYRSTKSILSLASNVIEKNFHRSKKQLWTDNDKGDPVQFFRTASDRDEAEKVLSIINSERSNGIRFSDIAVFYRTNSQSRIIELKLSGEIPYRIVKGHKFYDRKEIKDIVSYLQLVQNSNNDLCFERVINTPSRQIGKKTMELLKSAANENDTSLFDAIGISLNRKKVLSLLSFEKLIVRAKEIDNIVSLFNFIINKSGYIDMLKNKGDTVAENRLANIEELKNAIIEHSKNEDSSLEAFLDGAALTDDSNDISDDNVNLMTLHASKGLEFPVVIIVGADDGIIPHSNALIDPDQMQEERRLFYVGITRAKKKLYILSSQTRMMAGMMHSFKASRFVAKQFNKNKYF